MMEQTGNFDLAFIPEVNCQILEMPYIGKELSMLIILPSEIEDDSTGLERLERELTYEKLIQWTQPDMMKSLEVNVALPKFKMEENYDLEGILVSMGMKDAFDVSKSDFSGMSPSNDLVVSKVVHKAFVEVNEEGTEAAAVTAVTMILHCGYTKIVSSQTILSCSSSDTTPLRASSSMASSAPLKLQFPVICRSLKNDCLRVK